MCMPRRITGANASRRAQRRRQFRRGGACCAVAVQCGLAQTEQIFDEHPCARSGLAVCESQAQPDDIRQDLRDLRRAVAGIAMRHVPGLAVLSYREVDPVVPFVTRGVITAAQEAAS